MTDIKSLRHNIEDLDEQIHKLLTDRASLVEQVADYKRKKGIKPCVVSREAELVRDVLKWHSGPLDKSSVYCIWREIIGGMTLLQKDMHISASFSEGDRRHYCLEHARDYFGGALRISSQKGDRATINTVREGVADFAVVPYPEDDRNQKDQPWWSVIQHDAENNPDTQPLFILASLPFMDSRDEEKNAARSLVAGYFPFISSGKDYSFLYLKVSSSISRGKLIDMAQAQGLKAEKVMNWAPDKAAERTEHLMEVQGFARESDPAVQNLFKAFNDKQALLRIAGGYPAL